MNAPAVGGGVVKGPMMVILKQYVALAEPDEVETRLKDWEQARDRMRQTARDLELASSKLPEAFEETSLTTDSARRAFQQAATELHDKADQLDAAVKALGATVTITRQAKQIEAQLAASLPSNHGPAPDPSDPKYAQTGTGVDSAQASQNQKALQADRAAHAAAEQAIADAEREAAEQIKLIDNANYTAIPPVRAITDEPNSDGPSDGPTAPSSSGSYSDIQAARARAASYSSGVMYPGGWGQDLKAAEMESIKAYEAENKPEWNGTQWVNADGSPAPSTSYAMVETADGLAPLGGGTSGMAALAIGGGGALLGAGVAKALANKFAAGASAKAATASATSRSATARAGAAGARAGGGAGAGARGAGAGAGARGAGAGAGARGAGGRGGRGGPTGAGSRAGAGGAGGRGGKKDDKRNGQDQDWQADYTDDWTETASDVLDPNASRGWTPNAPQDDASSADKNGRKPS
ncbi:hypothetical protein ABT304_04975 [Nocardioides sp. NPDC000445]|uniref:hypothetical protein n=1 Tax=Nocardioides sp. NPDC000445 TaxID=3154257 RepID=UPI003324B4E4